MLNINQMLLGLWVLLSCLLALGNPERSWFQVTEVEGAVGLWVEGFPAKGSKPVLFLSSC